MSKNVFLTTSQPGEETTIAINVPMTRMDEIAAIAPCLRLMRLRAIPRSTSRELGDQAELIRSVMAAKLPCLLLTYYYGFNTGAPASVASHLSVIAAKVPSVVIASTAAETHEVNALPLDNKRPN